MVNDILPINNDVFDELIEKRQQKSTQTEQSAFFCTDTSIEIEKCVHTVDSLKNEIRVFQQRVKCQCAHINNLEDLLKTLREKCLVDKDCKEFLRD